MLLLLSIASLPACAPPPYDPATTGGVENDSPSLEIVWPPPETAHVGCVLVVVDIENHELAEFGEAVEGEGHWHIYYPSGGTTGYAACTTPYCLVDLSTANLGNISIEARLAGNDHGELTDAEGNYYSDTLPISVSAGTCTEGDLGGDDDDDTGGPGDTGDTGNTGDTGDTSGGS